ncbi:Uu.00g081610.m01.CDS01 [Anthostomella pinea]|uniref:Uu.00g081610.m01.CDS01 n=1 Tax=Anthostomella pinea TaxID=933095 RepID=A0AAI8YJF2_9PEZI|nr:Uu.00g081610.m01.CDS01 [Anthostomella pinea]
MDSHGPGPPHPRRPSSRLKQNPFLLADEESQHVASTHHSHGKPAAIVVYDDLDCRDPRDVHHPHSHSTQGPWNRSEKSDEKAKTSGHLQTTTVSCTSSEPQAPPKTEPGPAPHTADESTVHRHHSAGFHNQHHVAEHLAFGLGQEAYDRIQRAREETNKSISAHSLDAVATASADPVARSARQLKPLTPAQPVTRIASFQYTQDAVSPGHPSHDEHHSSAETVGPHSFAQHGMPVESMRESGSIHGRDDTQHHHAQRVVDHDRPANQYRQHSWFHLGKDSGYEGDVQHHLPAHEHNRFHDHVQSVQHSTQAESSHHEDEHSRENVIRDSPAIHPRTGVHDEHSHNSQQRSWVDQLGHSTSEHAVQGTSAAHEKHEESHMLDEPKPFQSKHSVPRKRISSPPAWLKNPTKQAANATAKLHHINTRRHDFPAHKRGYLSNINVDDLNENEASRERNSNQELRTRRRGSRSILASSHNEEHATSAPLPAGASHAGQHKDTHSRTDRLSNVHEHSQYIHKATCRESFSPFSQEVNKSSYLGLDPKISVQQASPVLVEQTQSQHARRHIGSPAPVHQGTVRSHDFDRGGPSFRSSAIGEAHERHNGRHDERHDERHDARHEGSALESHYQEATRRAKTELEEVLMETHEQGENSPRTISDRPLLQPRQLPLHHEASVTTETSEGHDTHHSYLVLERRESSHMIDVLSELEVHRPAPIPPPNHDCDWKERYMELTAEIRLLKAELSTQASFRGSEMLNTRSEQHQHEGLAPQDDGDLGIEGLTIVMHFKGKDDLVINTDLSQGMEPSESSEYLESR